LNQTLQIKNIPSPPLQNSRTKRTLIRRGGEERGEILTEERGDILIKNVFGSQRKGRDFTIILLFYL